MTQTYRNKSYTQRKAINSIMKFYKESTEEERLAGCNWYKEANEVAKKLSCKTGYSVMNIAGIIAALSPQTSWHINKMYVKRFLDEGINATASTRANKLKAEKCLKASSANEIEQILNGNKTKSFFLNIAYPKVNNVATIDRHALAICTQNPDKVNTNKKPVQLTNIQYIFFEACYIEAANQLGLLALELQAITWVTYRRLRNLN